MKRQQIRKDEPMGSDIHLDELAHLEKELLHHFRAIPDRHKHPALLMLKIMAVSFFFLIH